MKLNFEKSPDGLLPAIIQDSRTRQVLMLGYMNTESLQVTQQERRVTFWSRSKQRLWTKGETSGNFLEVEEIISDCDGDTLLIRVRPRGEVCHTGSDTCFDETNPENAFFLHHLEAVIAQRIAAQDEQSYTYRLWKKGPAKMAQKVGEEGVEVALDGALQNTERLPEEAADLLYHLLLLLHANGLELRDVVRVLHQRHQAQQP
ncbi:MAG: bifunctional phosphoribosyl-AMP cyclohydrolase/phosphoribosyl-ATP diphosphatase HisIE [Bernardetiaceae bacterium]